MQRRTEPSSTLKALLANVATSDLVSRRDPGDYASIEIVREPSDGAKTIRFQREHARDLTIRFARRMRSVDLDDVGTRPFVKYSAPYERIDIDVADPEIEELDLEDLEPQESVAAANLVGLDTIKTSSLFEIVESAPPSSSRPVLVVTILVAAFALGIGIPFLASL